jgi:hypothetical protein
MASAAQPNNRVTLAYRKPGAQRTKMTDGLAAMGVAPHSGWATVVVLGAAHANLHVLLRSRIELADRSAPESKQPFHAIEALDLDQAAQRLSHYRTLAEVMAFAAIQSIAADLSARGSYMTSVGVLESAGRKGSSLASILASHSLIHAADGDHFRNALAVAAERSGLTVCRVRARDLEAQAEAALRRPRALLRDAVNGLGRQVGPPWGADQKMAALLAWLLITQGSRATGSARMSAAS